MPVKNVECQIAEMQIGRHVSGEMLSPEALRQLEAHLDDCGSCTRVLADRRKALRSMLTQGYAAVTTDAPTPPKEHLLIQALRAKVETAETTASRPAVESSPRLSEPSTKKWNLDPLGLLASSERQGANGAQVVTNFQGRATHPANSLKSYAKPLVYSGALAAVLFFMGYFTHGQNSMLGDTAASKYPAPAGAAAPAVKPAPKKANQQKAAQNSEGGHTAKLAAPSSAQTAAEKPAPAASEPTKSAKGLGNAASTKDSSNANSTDLKPPSDPTDASGSQAPPATLRNHPHNEEPAARKRHSKARHISHHQGNMIRIDRPTNDIQLYDEAGNPIRG